MFGTLLESRARRERKTMGSVASVVAHAAVIALAVAATAGGETPPEPPRPGLIYIPTPPPPAPRLPREDGRRPTGPVAPDALRGAPPLIPPIDVPDELPAIDYSAPVTNGDDFKRGALHPGELAPGTPTAAGTVDEPLDVLHVDRPVATAGGCALRYPDVLRSANVEGDVLAQFVVDSAGRVVAGSFRALHTSHELFTQSVRACLPAMRFVPAEAGGRRVAQLVQQPFVFALDRR